MARVQAIAVELGYTADPIARALASGRTGSVAIVGSLRDMWQQQLAVMLSTGLRERGLSATIADVAASPEREHAVLRALAAQRIDAIVTLPVDPSAAYWAEVPSDVRVVSIGDALTERPDAGCVLFDNDSGVGAALAHLADLGHRSVAVIAPSLPTTPGRPAEILARSHGELLGVRVTVASCPASVSDAAAMLTPLLSSADRPTALFCLSDSIAFGAYRAARDLGLAIPGELSILGYDDSELASLVHPQLSTFGWDEQAIVDAAVASIDAAEAGVVPGGAELVQGESAGAGPVQAESGGAGQVRPVVFRPELIVRASTAAPGRA